MSVYDFQNRKFIATDGHDYDWNIHDLIEKSIDILENALSRNTRWSATPSTIGFFLSLSPIILIYLNNFVMKIETINQFSYWPDRNRMYVVLFVHFHSGNFLSVPLILPEKVKKKQQQHSQQKSPNATEKKKKWNWNGKHNVISVWPKLNRNCLKCVYRASKRTQEKSKREGLISARITKKHVLEFGANVVSAVFALVFPVACVDLIFNLLVAICRECILVYARPTCTCRLCAFAHTMHK